MFDEGHDQMEMLFIGHDWMEFTSGYWPLGSVCKACGVATEDGSRLFQGGVNFCVGKQNALQHNYDVSLHTLHI